MSVEPVPKGYQSVVPYLMVEDPESLIQFLKAAFNAREQFRMPGADGNVQHAEVSIGDSRIMMGASTKDHPPMVSMFYLYVHDADAAHKQAVAAGGKSLHEPEDMFYGDRAGAVEDSSGNTWWVATRKKELSPDELKKAMASKKM